MTVLQPIDRWTGAGPGFNRSAADAVYKAMMAMDEDEALLFGRVVVADALQYDLVAHGEEIGKALDAHFADRVDRIRARLARTAVTKARAGADADGELRALLQLSKAYGDDPYNRNDQGEFAATESRHHEAHAHIGYDSDFRTLHHKHARQLGIPPAPARLSNADRARYQQAYRQISDLVAPYRGRAGDALLHLNITDAKGRPRTPVVEVPAAGQDLKVGDALQPGDHLVSASVSVRPSSRGAQGALYDALSAAHVRHAGQVSNQLYDQGALNAERMKDYGREINPEVTADNHLDSPVFRRIGAGSKLLQDSLGDAAPKKVQYALAVGNHLGTYGPEAQKVIGPSADRAAYRYRGTERAVDPRLGNAFESIRRNPALQSPTEKRYALIHGTEDDQGNWRPSAVLSYFKAHLPKPERNNLQRKAGAIPPSEGVIIDRRGRVAHQAVGYGDDWYLPFNLKNLKALHGGEYIRTRTFGGPTTEDIYTGLISGARSVTVVSNTGVYTVEFDDNLRGGRRFNDKAARMVGRYGHLLDAVKSEQVTTGGIDPSRMAELRTKAARQFDPVEDEKDYRAELDKLMARERLQPTMSKAQRNQAAVDWLSEQAEQRRTPDGHVMTAQEMVADLINSQAGVAHRAHVTGARQMGVEPVRDLGHYQAEAEGRLADSDPEAAAAKVADALGRRAQFDAYMKRAEADNAAALTPLRLDGQGYKQALDALQEQFPYYIAGVDFHPWSDAHHGTDTGYVKPRHNRPERALAGYFDASITGHGKVHADSTRYQNFAVARGKLRPYGPAKRTEEKRAENGGAKPISDQTAAELRADADRKLLGALLDQTTFGPDASIPQAGGNPPAKVAGMDIRQALASANAPDTPLTALYKTPRHELEARLDDPARATQLHRDLQQAYEYATTHRLFKPDAVSPEVLRDFRAEGRAPKSTALPSSVPQILSGQGEYDFTGKAYDASRAPDVDEVREAYRDNNLIAGLVRAGKLPEDPGATDFDARVRELEGELREQHSANLRDAGRAGSDARARGLQRDTEGLARARQLHRRYGEAVKRQTEVHDRGESAPVGAATETENHFHLQPPSRQPGESAEDYADTLRAWRDVMGAMNRPGGPDQQLPSG